MHDVRCGGDGVGTEEEAFACFLGRGNQAPGGRFVARDRCVGSFGGYVGSSVDRRSTVGRPSAGVRVCLLSAVGQPSVCRRCAVGDPSEIRRGSVGNGTGVVHDDLPDIEGEVLSVVVSVHEDLGIRFDECGFLGELAFEEVYGAVDGSVEEPAYESEREHVAGLEHGLVVQS